MFLFVDNLYSAIGCTDDIYTLGKAVKDDIDTARGICRQLCDKLTFNRMYRDTRSLMKTAEHNMSVGILRSCCHLAYSTCLVAYYIPINIIERYGDGVTSLVTTRSVLVNVMTGFSFSSIIVSPPVFCLKTIFASSAKEGSTDTASNRKLNNRNFIGLL